VTELQRPPFQAFRPRLLPPPPRPQSVKRAQRLFGEQGIAGHTFDAEMRFGHAGRRPAHRLFAPRQSLRFAHPVNGVDVEIHAPLPGVED